MDQSVKLKMLPAEKVYWQVWVPIWDIFPTTHTMVNRRTGEFYHTRLAKWDRASEYTWVASVSRLALRLGNKPVFLPDSIDICVY